MNIFKTNNNVQFVTKKQYDSIDECKCGGPIFKYKDITKNEYVVKCGYYKNIIEIDKNTKKKQWIIPKKVSCDWKAIHCGERPIFQEINKNISKYIENKVVGDVHKQLEEKLKVLFRFLYISTHSVTLDEINVLVEYNLLRKPIKTFYFPTTSLFMKISHKESYEEYEKRIFSKKIIDKSYINYINYISKVEKPVVQKEQVSLIKNENKNENKNQNKNQNKKQIKSKIKEEIEFSQFIIADSDKDESSDNSDSDYSDHEDSDLEQDQESDSEKEEVQIGNIDETESDFDFFVDENVDNFDDEASDKDYYDD